MAPPATACRPAVGIHGCERPCTNDDKLLKVCQGELYLRGRVTFELSFGVPGAQIRTYHPLG